MKNISPGNIDFLGVGNKCNLNCRQSCYFVEQKSLSNVEKIDDLSTMEKIIDQFPEAAFFAYPKEITTSMDISQIFPITKQTHVLSNGILLDEEKIDCLKAAGILKIKITLFANFRDHSLFYNINERQYEIIKNNISLCKSKGLLVTVNNIISQPTKNSIAELVALSSDLGVDKIRFIRLQPMGNGQNADLSLFITENDMPDIILAIEKCKQQYPSVHLGYTISFGPNFYLKTREEALEKIRLSHRDWTKSKYLCPAINGDYLGISMKTGTLYHCFWAMSTPEFVAGRMDLSTGEIIEWRDTVLSAKILREKLRGNCHKDNCKYQDLCLGGCRCAAFAFAKMRDEADPLFAGMDICITKSQEKILG